LSLRGHAIWAQEPGKPPSYVLALRGEGDAYMLQVRELYGLLGFAAPRQLAGVVTLPIRLGFGKPAKAEIQARTRSLYDLFSIAAASVEVPGEQIQSGLAPRLPPTGAAGQSIRIRRSKERPEQAMVAVKRHGWWYSVDARDTESKLTFRLLEAIISVRMAEAVERKATPVLTVPVSRSQSEAVERKCPCNTVKMPRLAATVITMLVLVGAKPGMAQEKPSIGQIEAIAEEAYLYGFPMIVGYDVLYKYFIDRDSGQFKAPINQIHNEARVFTPEDTGISTPNSDTPYSMVFLDLRAEPMVLCMPEIEKRRYYDVQLVDLYTDNYGYMGSRTTGSGAGCYLVSGPEWKGETPKGIAKAFRSETQFSLVIYRTQLFDPADMDNVKKVQAG
jgi:hypothetical protein